MNVGVVVAVLVLGGLAFAAWQAHKPAGPAPEAVIVAPKPAAESEPAPQPPPQPAAIAAATKPERVGDRFSDPGGPELVLARASQGTRPALAVMASAVDAALYRRYADFRKRTPPRCPNAPAPAQGCLDLAAARDFARWLSEETGEKYRVPTRAELDAGIAQVARSPAYAWTGTCHEVRVAKPRGLAKRSWARVRKVFGRPAAQQYEVRCEGHYALKLDGRGDAARPYKIAAPETVAVLVREVDELDSSPQ